jgi:hypothetical protein
MLKRRETWFYLAVGLTVLALVSLPFLFAFETSGEEYRFAGFLVNPKDGNTYLAKMYQGWEGDWRFRLPFTSQPGEGAYLFMFYIVLGHLARITRLPILTVFHLTRILSTVLLLWSLSLFYKAILPKPSAQRFAFAASALGSGMGWMLIFNDSFTSDFWVAEAYPFLSAFTNPHFPLGLSLVLWLLKPPYDMITDWKKIILSAITAFSLAVISPFGIGISLLILTLMGLVYILHRKKLIPILIRLSIIGMVGLPILIYYLWVANTDPMLSIWNAQNLTPSPPLWDIVLSLSPALILAVTALPKYFKTVMSRDQVSFSLPVIWAGIVVLAIYLPINLQRRFMMGLFVPVVGMAAVGLEALSSNNSRAYNRLSFGFFLLAVPTNLVILLAAFGAIQNKDPQIYLTNEEASALHWLKENTESDSVILSSPEMGLYIPAYTGRRVIYGHPFETVNADLAEETVLNIYRGELTENQVKQTITRFQVDYVMLGPREREIGSFSGQKDWLMMYSRGGIEIYRPRR